MSQPIVRRSKNWQFSHAAAAMGAFWEKVESRRMERIRQLFVAGTRAIVAPAPASSGAGGSLRPSF
ncbi:MAG: hypothetical protein ABIV06_06960 [Thermoanaerobaculia bacterium]